MAEFEKLLKTVFYYPDANSIAMATKGKERLRIDGDGHFGFGTRQNNQETVRIQGETSDASKLALLINNAAQNSLLAVRNDGNVGIGTSTPTYRLEVNGSFHASGEITANTIRTTGGSLGLHGELTTNGNITVNGNIAANGNISAGGNIAANGSLNYGQLAKLEVADNFTATIRAADLLLGHSSRRGAIGRGPGRALVDLTRELHLNYAADWPDGIRYYGALLSACTRELKENIEEFSSEEAAAILENLNPVKFNLKADDRKARHLGFIAEDCPELVTSTDRKAVNHDHIIAVLTKIIKAQGQAIVSLTERATLLETAFSKFVENAASQSPARPPQTTASRKRSKQIRPGIAARAKSKLGTTAPRALPSQRRKSQEN